MTNTIAFGLDKITFYHTDQVGTPLAITDQNGVKVWEAEYMPFGEEYTVSGIIDNNKRFVGKEKDVETGLSYFGARYMDVEIGRFLAPDPVRAVNAGTGGINTALLGNPQRLNPYTYSLNNPYKYVDPDGRDIAVVYGVPQGKNRFGHIAGGVTDKGIYSSGTKEPFGSSFSDYLKNQSAYRDSIVYVFPTSKEQDQAFVDTFIEARKEKHSAVGNNCADVLGKALKSADIIKDSAALMFPGLIDSYMRRKFYEGKVSSVVSIKEGNKDWSEIDSHLGQFNPASR
jgi:RHS repeat-associated protein